MRFVQIETLPAGKALVYIDKLTHAVPQEGSGTRLYQGAQQLDVPHTLDELENVLAGRERGDAGEGSQAGFTSGEPRRHAPVSKPGGKRPVRVRS